MANNMATMQGCCDCGSVVPPLCLDFLPCVWDRTVHIETNWTRPTHSEDCEGELFTCDFRGSLKNGTIEFAPGGPTSVAGCFSGSRGTASWAPTTSYPWRDPHPTGVLESLIDFDCGDDNLFYHNELDGAAVSVECDGEGNVTFSLWIHYMGCSFGCGCGFARLLESDPIPYLDLQADMASALVEIPLHSTGLYDCLITPESTGTLRLLGSPPCDSLCDEENIDCSEPPSVVSFELIELGGCRYRIIYELAEGACQLAYAWLDSSPGDDSGVIIPLPVEPIGPDWPNEVDVYLGPNECGASGGSGNPAELKVLDECGCCDVETAVFQCCDCVDSNGEQCASPPGGLSITQDEEDPCCWHLEATGDDTGYEGVCSDSAFIEFILLNSSCTPALDEFDNLPCTCEEIESGDCGGISCSGGLGLGQSTQICVTENTTLLWRAREQECGCWGPWNEEELTCLPCECCEGELSGFFLTVSGVTNCPPDGITTCNCTAINGTYFVPSTGGCSGSATFETHTCDQGGPELIPGFLHLEWNIFCNEEGYFLEVTYFVETGSPGIGDSGTQTQSLGETMPTCLDISETFIYDGSPLGCSFCQASDITIVAEAA